MNLIMIQLGATAGASFLAVMVIVAYFRRKALKLGLVDHPNERSSHTRVTPRGGGIGIVLAWSIGCIVWWFWQRETFFSGGRLAVLLICTLVISGISFLDDYRSVGIAPRFATHLICAAAAIGTFGWFESVEFGPVVTLGGFGLIIAVLWVVGLTNVYNFMDGIDGLAGIQGLITALAWCVAGMHIGVLPVVVVGALIAGGCAGFLMHNWSPARIFMGDVGSAFLGFLFGILPLLALREHADAGETDVRGRLPVFALFVIWPFIADGMFTFFRRLAKGEPVWKAHRSHLYQRLIQSGLSHAIVASYYGLWAILCAAAGLGFLWSGWSGVVIAIPLMFFVSTCLLTWHLEKRKQSRGAVQL